MNSLEELEDIIDERGSADPRISWTAKLLSQGRRKCAQKFGEEAVEAVIAGTSGDKGALIAESADVLYHLLVLLKSNEVRLEQVLHELENRKGTSGISERLGRIV